MMCIMMHLSGLGGEYPHQRPPLQSLVLESELARLAR